MDKTEAFKELTWTEVRSDFAIVNPVLADIIDDISPDDTYTFFFAKYPYGSQILIDGKMFLPTSEGELIPFEDSRISQNVKDKIGYVMGTNPMTMVLKNTLDLYITIENRVIMYSLIQPGDVFGTWQLLDDVSKGGMFFTPIPLWDMTAGARSVFMLPKITEAAAFSKVRRKFDLKSEPPKNLTEHWQTFKEIASHPAFGQAWNTEILFFSKKWVDSVDDPGWAKFKSYMTSRAWGASEFWRNQFCWDLTFSRIQAKRGLRPCPFVADIANHLLGMSVGAVPGFQALTDDAVAPVKGLMKVFEEDYGSRYAPVIIGPANFSLLGSHSKSVFYSFQYHTALKLSQKSSNRSSAVTDMYNIRSLLEKYLEDIQNSELNIDGTVLYEIAKKVKFNFYHYTADYDNKMLSSNDVFESSTTFQAAMELTNIKAFPKNAPFLNGCIEVTSED